MTALISCGLQPGPDQNEEDPEKFTILAISQQEAVLPNKLKAMM